MGTCFARIRFEDENKVSFYSCRVQQLGLQSHHGFLERDYVANHGDVDILSVYGLEKSCFLQKQQSGKSSEGSVCKRSEILKICGAQKECQGRLGVHMKSIKDMDTLAQ